MKNSARLPAVAAYLLPVLGWLYVFFAERKNPLAMYHLRQALGLAVALAATLAGWAVVAWVLAWIPYLDVVGVALFTLVIVAFVGGLLAWLLGLRNALQGRLVPLPLVGQWADRLPVR